MNNKVLNAIGATLEDVATSVTESKLGKILIPTVEELNETIANSDRLSKPLYTENIQRALNTMLNSAGVPADVAEQMSKTVNVNNYTQAIDNWHDDISKYTDVPVDNIIQTAKKRTEQVLSSKVDINTVGQGGSKNAKIHKALAYPQAYFMNPDKKVQAARIGAVAATYAGGALAGRGLSGGTLTRDNYGRKDIAGVPFI